MRVCIVWRNLGFVSVMLSIWHKYRLLYKKKEKKRKPFSRKKIGLISSLYYIRCHLPNRIYWLTDFIVFVSQDFWHTLTTITLLWTCKQLTILVQGILYGDINYHLKNKLSYSIAAFVYITIVQLTKVPVKCFNVNEIYLLHKRIFNDNSMNSITSRSTCCTSFTLCFGMEARLSAISKV